MSVKIRTSWLLLLKYSNGIFRNIHQILLKTFYWQWCYSFLPTRSEDVKNFLENMINKQLATNVIYKLLKLL